MLGFLRTSSKMPKTSSSDATGVALGVMDEPPCDKGKNREALDVWCLAEGVMCNIPSGYYGF